MGTLLRWDEAAAESKQAGALARELGARLLYAHSVNNLSLLHLERGQFTQAVSLFEQAQPAVEDADSGHLAAVIAGNLCTAFTCIGDYRGALDHGEVNFALRRQLGYRTGEAIALHYLARALQGWASTLAPSTSASKHSPWAGAHELGVSNRLLNRWRPSPSAYTTPGEPPKP